MMMMMMSKSTLSTSKWTVTRSLSGIYFPVRARQTLWSLLATSLLLLQTQVTVTRTETTNLQRLSRAHLEFALSLYREMTNDARPTDNVVVSPYSVASVLSQLWLGAGEGSNASEVLARVLHYEDVGLESLQVHEAFRSSLDTLHDPDYRNVVQTANAVFVQAGMNVAREYEGHLRQYYNSSVDEVDFESGESIARSIINRWVSKQTLGQIPVLLQSPLPSHTRLLLVNALSLKAFWKNSFDPLVTAAKATFHQSPDSKIEIPMMTGRFEVLMGSSSDLNCRLLELPFRGRRLSMFILLPDVEEATSSESEEDGSRSSNRNKEKKVPSLVKLEKNLNAATLKHLFSTLREETVRIRMPRFRISHNSALLETLSRMGLASIFDETRANFSQISDKPLHVSTIAHRVVLEVREKGAAAAAATVTGIERLGSFGEKFFEVNRPFLFFIWDYHSGALLFIGRVAHPEPLPP